LYSKNLVKEAPWRAWRIQNKSKAKKIVPYRPEQALRVPRV
jgi:hypothetical protein